METPTEVKSLPYPPTEISPSTKKSKKLGRYLNTAQIDYTPPRSVVAECLGCLLLVLLGCGSCAGGDQEGGMDDQANTVSLLEGLDVTLTRVRSMGNIVCNL